MKIALLCHSVCPYTTTTAVFESMFAQKIRKKKKLNVMKLRALTLKWIPLPYCIHKCINKDETIIILLNWMVRSSAILIAIFSIKGVLWFHFFFWYRVPKCDVTKFSFMHFSIFMTIFQQNMIKNPHTPNLTWIGSWWPEIWPHEYLISPIEISVNWPSTKKFPQHVVQILNK